MDKQTLTLDKQNIHKYVSLNKIESKFVAKQLKYGIMFKDILTFLGLDYRDALLIILYLIVTGISTLKIRSIG